MSEVETTIENGKVETKIGRIDPADVLRGEIESIEEGIAQLFDRREQIDSQVAALAAEREQLEATVAEAQTKLEKHNDALALVEAAADLAPNLPGELKPAAGGDGVPPTSDSPAATHSRNGGPPASAPDADEGGKGDRPGDPPGDAEDQPGAAGSGSGRPGTAKRVTLSEQIVDAIRRTAAPGEWLAQREILASMPEGTSANSMRFALQGLVKAGTVEAKGERRGRRYRLKTKRSPATPAAARKARPSSEDKPKGTPVGKRQEPTDEGRVMGALEGQRLDMGQLATATGIGLAELRPIVGKLMREGDIRCKKGRTPTYYAVP